MNYFVKLAIQLLLFANLEMKDDLQRNFTKNRQMLFFYG